MLGRALFVASTFIMSMVPAGGIMAAAPEPWGFGFQPAASPVMAEINDFHNIILVVTGLITLAVLGLLVYVIVRFNAARNPVPSKVTHNIRLEVAWTLIPILILAGIAVPSFKLLYFMDRTHDAEMTLKVTGYQWYWAYEYPDHGDIEIEANMVLTEDLEDGQLRLLETDNRVVLPVNTDIRLLFTSDDVIHSWAVPAFGVKVDSVPGRTNEAWVRIEREGVYYGQCSELCGVDHAYMPIAVEAVSPEAFAEWVKETKEAVAAGEAPARVAEVAQ